ncbi:hypothetical protein TNIN_175451 [Trichonephila inaurata madagascariensis]|uniref:Uncharacterized protein n=1 Tax=Trichonephila inaurata madagascariensis TaxID=2747483 RepID=A0A8X6YTH1_9ARAC|nr:hypothetical protein TNIN_175451 [Trichonephila inaurata madagascariensis]
MDKRKRVQMPVIPLQLTAVSYGTGDNARDTETIKKTHQLKNKEADIMQSTKLIKKMLDCKICSILVQHEVKLRAGLAKSVGSFRNLVWLQT